MGGLGATQQDFSSPRVLDLVEEGVPVVAPPGMVYSTAPRSRRAEDGHAYVTKGPDIGILAAEALGYGLARPLGIAVPEFAFGRDTAGLWFASRKLDRALRDPAPFIRKRREAIARVIALDIWLCNSDRNMGGLLIDQKVQAAEDDVVAIDFEKSHVASDAHPLIKVPTVPSAKLWPTGELGTKMIGATQPHALIDEIEQISDHLIDGVIGSIVAVLSAWTWAESTCAVLKNRRKNIHKLIAEVWR
jgi:hypothetical protein